MRIKIGAGPACAACSAAANLKLWAGTTRSSWSAVVISVAGYFVPRSYDRRGARLFLTRRWLRIGIPLAVIVLLVHLPVSYLIGGAPQPRQFLIGLYERGWQPIYLHLWFVAHLLLYCFAYTALRQISGLFEVAPRKVPLASDPLPTSGSVLPRRPTP